MDNVSRFALGMLVVSTLMFIAPFTPMLTGATFEEIITSNNAYWSCVGLAGMYAGARHL